ncbi:DUF1049 domain-containing protein [Streptomyces sp. NPDC008150]|uniref:DUF1049 domain-containing protein n=1 Tax=Streptomyces sp. NPDC008150 TaxID=3364816 RepID=UPI0036F126AD
MRPKTVQTAPDVGADGSPSKFLTPSRIAVLVLVALGLVFIFENTHSVRIRLLVPVVTMPLWGALLITAVIGGLAGAYLVRRRPPRSR